MASKETSQSRIELYDSALTLPSDSENYSAHTEQSPSHESTTSQVTLYKPPTVWRVLRGAAINLLLPFVNGLMLGFGELLAHEVAFRFGWSGTKIFPTHRRSQPAGVGFEVREQPSPRRWRSRNDTVDLGDVTALE